MPVRALDKDDGVTAIIVASALVALIGMAAIVVDGGQGFSERRQAQSAADFAALAALQFATSCDPVCSVDIAVENGEAEAKTVVEGNLPSRALDWDTCTDPERPAIYTRHASTECISFTHNLDQTRVVIPNDTVETAFGRAIGTAVLNISAEAEAGQGINQSASIVPYTLAGTSSLSCLFSNQAPQTIPPCDGPSDGNFGYVDIALFGNDDLGTPSTCVGGDPNTRAALNTAIGADHIMTTWSSGDPRVNDHVVCPNRSENVNELRVETGSATGATTDGLIEGVSGNLNGQPIPSASGRLECDDASDACTMVRGEDLDDTPLWHFLDGACAGTDTRDEMTDCLSDWSSGPIFEDTIAAHPRFVAVPVFDVYPINGASNNYPIVRFAAVYLETTFQGCNANRCTTVFSPGEAGDGDPCPDPIEDATVNCGHGTNAGPDAVEGLTAFQLKLEMLPASVRDLFPGVGQNRTTALIR